MTTNPIALDLLKLAEHYLSALHGPVARHDQLGLNLSCGGCALRDEIRDVLPKLAAVVPGAPATRTADRIAEALYAHNHPGWATRYTDLDQDERDTYLARADAVLAVLPPPTDRAAEIEQLRKEHATWRKLGKRNLERAHEENARLRAALERIRKVVRRLAAHAVGFQDVLDDTDRGPWGATVGADIAELRRMADEAQQSCPGYETVPNRCACPCEGCKHNCAAHHADEAGGARRAADEKQPDSDREPKPGDRVRVTYEGTWLADDDPRMVLVGNHSGDVWRNVAPDHARVEVLPADEADAS